MAWTDNSVPITKISRNLAFLHLQSKRLPGAADRHETRSCYQISSCSRPFDGGYSLVFHLFWRALAAHGKPLMLNRKFCNADVFTQSHDNRVKTT